MQKRHRIFIAINLPEDIKRQLFAYSQKWPELPARWTSKNNLHITLEFLGDLTEEELGEVCVAVKEVAERHNSFSINLNSISYGPSKKNSLHPHTKRDIEVLEENYDDSNARYGVGAKMVWVEGEKPDDLIDLKQDLQEYLLERVKFRPENKGFVLHITLARIREWEWKKIEPEERPEIKEEIDLIFTVESIEVMESELKRGGPEYTVIESHSFKE